MRASFNCVVIPFKLVDNHYQFCILKRSDAGFWQPVSGGGEDSESLIECAVRETFEETGIKIDSEKLIRLQTEASVPVCHFKDSKYWASDLYVIKAYYFSFESYDYDIVISDEHSEFKWLSYQEAYNILKWDSDKTALWELNERLKKSLN